MDATPWNWLLGKSPHRVFSLSNWSCWTNEFNRFGFHSKSSKVVTAVLPVKSMRWLRVQKWFMTMLDICIESCGVSLCCCIFIYFFWLINFTPWWLINSVFDVIMWLLKHWHFVIGAMNAKLDLAMKPPKPLLRVPCHSDRWLRR